MCLAGAVYRPMVESSPDGNICNSAGHIQL